MPNPGTCSEIINSRLESSFFDLRRRKITKLILKPVLSLSMLGSGSDDLCTVESRKRAFLVQPRNGPKIETNTFLGCEAFSLTSQKDASGHQKGQAQFVDEYLSLLAPR